MNKGVSIADGLGSSSMNTSSLACEKVDEGDFYTGVWWRGRYSYSEGDKTSYQLRLWTSGKGTEL